MKVYVVMKFSKIVQDKYTKKELYIAYTDLDYACKMAKRFNETATEDEFYYVDINGLYVV